MNIILRLSQEMDCMMSMMHFQINGALTTTISDRIIPEIRKIVSSMSSSGKRDTEASLSPNSQENRENTTGPKTKSTKKDSRSACELRDTDDSSPYSHGKVLSREPCSQEKFQCTILFGKEKSE